MSLEVPGIAAADRLQRGLMRFPWGIDFLDDALTGISETDLNLLGASTGVGKTQIAAHVALSAASRGAEVYYFALEAEAGEIERRILYSELAREWFKRNPYGKPGVALRYISWLHGDLEQELFPIEREIHDRVRLSLSTLHTIYKHDSFTVKDFVKTFAAVYDHAKLIVIDHLHYFDIDQRDEMAGLRIAIREIRNAALQLKKPILLVAHLRKSERGSKSPIPDIDDFYGSSDVVKIGVNAVMISRAEDKQLPGGAAGTWIYIPKARHAGDAVGYAGLVGYDLRTGVYTPGYQIYRARRYSEPVELAYEHFPRWAKRAVIPEAAKAWLPKWPE